MNRVRIDGASVLVMGASGGVGSALAHAFAARRARLALVARRSGPLEQLAAALRANGAAAVSVHAADLGDATSAAAAVAAARAAHGGLDGAIHAAGIAGHADFVAHDAGRLEALVRTNVLGVLHPVRALLPGLVERRGWLVLVSSIAGRLGQPGESVYSATKFALTGFAEALTIELAEQGVHLLTVYPALVKTGFTSEAELARLPAAVRRDALDPAALARAIVRALERRRHELTLPRYTAGGYVVRALAPALFRRILRRTRGRAPLP